MLDLELSWQQAAIASGCLFAGATLARLKTRPQAAAPGFAARVKHPRIAAAAGVAREAATLLALFALWQYAGSFSVMSTDEALTRAQWLWDAERAVHMPSEAAVQQFFLPHPLLVQVCNLYYAGLHFPVLIACLIWLFARHRGRYRYVRTTVVLFTASALLMQLIPVAPPRMLASDGMVDTAIQYGQSVYGKVGGFEANQLSAMPSVHVGWALLVALVVVHVSRSRWRWLALAYPAVTTVVVVATANHFWLDGVVAALLLALAFVVQRAGRAARRRVRGAGTPAPDRPREDSVTAARAGPVSLARARPVSLARARPVSLARARPVSLAWARPVSLAWARLFRFAWARPVSLARARLFRFARARLFRFAWARPVSLARARLFRFAWARLFRFARARPVSLAWRRSAAVAAASGAAADAAEDRQEAPWLPRPPCGRLARREPRCGSTQPGPRLPCARTGARRPLSPRGSPRA